MELIAGTGETAQPHALEAVMGFQMSKTHFHLLAFVAGFGEPGRCHQRAGVIAGFLVQVARDLA